MPQAARRGLGGGVDNGMGQGDEKNLDKKQIKTILGAMLFIEL
jgi:hypothetical protein